MNAGAAGPAGYANVQRLIITRAEPEASVWVHALRERGWPAEGWPLVVIAEPSEASDVQALRRWRLQWPGQDALMFVSAAAVTHFMSDVRPPSQPVHTRFWAPGPGTARVLAAHLAALGVGADRIDAPAADAAQFDSEHLWPVVAGQMTSGKRLLIVRGASGESEGGGLPGSGREWLIDQCRAAGATVDACAAYARHKPALSAAQRGQLLQWVGADTVWLFNSSEALAPLAPVWPADAKATAMVTHPRIALAARAAGFARVIETRPTLEDVMRGLESIALPP